ncbi:MAG: hypothetical protein KDC34_06305 [Saprospiraceae bacterium]|nr:hypothetical protein [Saprospiraceae bacterium]
MKDSQNRKSDIQQELEALSPLLLRLKGQESGLTVPPNYFRNLEKEVAEKLVTPQQESSWLSKIAASYRWSLQPKLAFSFAAIAVLVVAGLWVLNRNQESEVAEFAQLSSEEIESYIDRNIDDFDLDLLVEYAASDQGVSSIKLHTESLNEEELGEYLDDYIDELELDKLDDLY